MLNLSPVGIYSLVVVPIFFLYLLYITLATLKQNAGTRLFQQKKYAEAAAVYQALLKRPLPSGMEADTRRRLADTLDVLGEAEAAGQERERAGILAQKGSGDPMALATQGDLLERKQQHDDACHVYTRALALMPAIVPAERATLMAKLSSAHYNAGRPADALKWAEAALNSRPNPAVRLVMFRMAGVGYSDAGEIEKVEDSYRRSLELAETSGNREEIAQSLAMLADVQRKRGRFAESIAAARRAVDTCDSPFRGGRLVEVESLRETGRFDEARAVVARMKQGPRHDQPRIERRMQAMCALTLAWIETTADRPDAALAALEETREHLKEASQSSVWPPPPASGEDKLGIYCDATQMRVYAQLGQQDAARRLRASVESRISRYMSDRSVMMSVYGQFARAAYFSGDLAESRAFWQRYLDCRPNPVGLPGVYYWLGEIHLRLGETDAAREAFRQAALPGIDSLDARRAQARLNEIDK